MTESSAGCPISRASFAREVGISHPPPPTLPRTFPQHKSHFVRRTTFTEKSEKHKIEPCSQTQPARPQPLANCSAQESPLTPYSARLCVQVLSPQDFARINPDRKPTSP